MIGYKLVASNCIKQTINPILIEGKTVTTLPAIRYTLAYMLRQLRHNGQICRKLKRGISIAQTKYHYNVVYGISSPTNYGEEMIAVLTIQRVES